MGWFDILKISRLEDVWRKNREKDKAANQADYSKRRDKSKYARHQNRKHRCDMCGRGVAPYNRHETALDTGSTYCKRCAQQRDEAATT